MVVFAANPTFFPPRCTLVTASAFGVTSGRDVLARQPCTTSQLW